jgi:DNA-binding response OmpR family regulator
LYAVVRILVVEDEPDLRELMEGGLRAAGYEVDLAEDGRQALRKASDHRPDLVLLDLMLPDCEGTEVCRRLRQAETTAETGVIVVSARTDLRDRIAAFEQGADDYVTKPYSFRELLFRIQAVLRRSGDVLHPRLGAAGLRRR